ncbi:MAG: hypothetical protein R3321_05850 [Nitrososphaeraceae archaeon]|nr:hypothetical protein [Nitrososphaeraceae archaeon]
MLELNIYRNDELLLNEYIDTNDLDYPNFSTMTIAIKHWLKENYEDADQLLTDSELDWNYVD